MSPKPAPPVTNWVELECGNDDCAEKKHWYPKEGVRVRLKKAELLRQPGTDDTNHLISAYEWGRVETFEPAFHQAIVNFSRGRKVWIDVEDILDLDGRNPND